MSDSDTTPSLFSPEQVEAISKAIARFGELGLNAHAAMTAAGARLLSSLPPETSALPQEEKP